jgi:Domain of unknown function (DUF4352)
MQAKQLMAIFGVLAFLGTFAVVVTTGAAFLAVKLLGEERLSRWAAGTSGWFFGRRGLARKILFVAAILLAGYGVTLVGASTASHEWELAPGAEKYFCEIDCHLAYSIAGVEKAKSVGSGDELKTADGIFYIVKLRTRFDEKTISSERGNSPLTPSPRKVTLVDDQGREYSISPVGQPALKASLRNEWIPMTQELQPGESYETQLVFDVPPGARGLKLLVSSPTEPAWLGRFLIGDEDSILHKKVYLRVASKSIPAGGSSPLLPAARNSKSFPDDLLGG